MKKTVKAGDLIQDAVTASWFNQQNKRRLKGQNLRLPSPENPVRVRCFSGSDISRFDAANIVGPAISYEDLDGEALQYFTVGVQVDDTLVADKWGIVQGPCYPDHPSFLTVLGVTWANFTYTSGHTHVDVVGGVLTSGTSGKAIILSAPEDTGLPGLILIGAGVSTSDCILAKTPVGGIPACTGTGPYTFGSAVCTIVSDDGVVGAATETIKNIVNKVIAGNVIIKAEKVGSIYVVDVASCPVA